MRFLAGQQRLVEQDEAAMTLAITCREACPHTIVTTETRPPSVHCLPRTLHKNTAHTPDAPLNLHEN